MLSKVCRSAIAEMYQLPGSKLQKNKSFPKFMNTIVPTLPAIKQEKKQFKIGKNTSSAQDLISINKKIKINNQKVIINRKKKKVRRKKIL